VNVPFWTRHDEPEDSSFPQLVFAHFLRQRELYAAAYEGAPNTDRALHGPADEEYRRKLAAFTRKHGEIVDAYWCSHEISGVALTGRRRWTWRGLVPHRETESKLHTATDWATRHSQEISSQLYACEAMAIRANEVLLGTSERIVMQLLHSLSARLLAVVDRDSAPEPAAVAKAVAEGKAQLRSIRSYYDRAGQKAVRIIYVGGMLAGLGLVGIALLLLWAAGSSDAVLTAVGMGGVGAVVSVLSRMANRDSRFQLDHDDVGQKEARRLGAFRPFIGATFGALLYLAVASNLVSISTVDTKALPSIAVIAFLAGFSERWAKVVLDLAPPAPPRDPRQPERPGGEQGEAVEEAAIGARR
jgi:hypothetical protein